MPGKGVLVLNNITSGKEKLGSVAIDQTTPGTTNLVDIKIGNVSPQLDDTDKIGVSLYGKGTAAGDTAVDVDANGHLQIDILSTAGVAANFVRKESSQNLAVGALSYTTNFNAVTKIKQVLIHASGNINETITISFNSVTGSNYDTTLSAEALTGEANFVYRPGELILLAGDELTITCTNAGGVNTVYVTVIGETIL